MKSIWKFIALISVCFLIGLPSVPAWAAKVSKVKGKKVLIDLEGETAEKGQIFYILSSSGKKKGMVKIVSIKGDKAIAKLGKGKAANGDGLEAKGSGSSAKSKDSRGRSNKKSARKDKASSKSGNMGWGLLLGMGMDSMSVELDTVPVESASLAGSGISYKALFDYGLFEKIWFRGTFGIESFNAEGSETNAACDSKVCSVNIQYLSLDFWGRYLFSLSSFRSWLGAGFTLWFPMSKETTALETNSITNTSVMAIGGGFDWQINPKFYVPFQVEYGLLPASEQVSASAIAIRLGIGMNF
ncbi:MAG: hypothetical protein KDD35_06285 [Bdellovibrionales bacterium]|nr:hypothetical protein [Bdellovibrionales bacterium]